MKKLMNYAAIAVMMIAFLGSSSIYAQDKKFPLQQNLIMPKNFI